MLDNEKYIEGMIYSKTISHMSAKLTKMQLSELRKSKHLTQKELSTLSGLSTNCISGIEGDDGNPTLKSILKYIDTLGYEMLFKKKSI